MFASRILLKYAVKPVSPPRNLAPQETTKVFQYSPAAKYCAGYMPRGEGTDEYEAVKSTRMPKSEKLCSRSEPKRINRKKWSQLEESIVNHPNFEKAAALVQMLGDDSFGKCTRHQIGSLPVGKAPFSPNADIQTIEAAVNLVRNVIQAKEAEKEVEDEVEKEDESTKRSGKQYRQQEISIPAENFNLDRPSDPNKDPKGAKPYVINIYLDTKQAKVFRDSDLKEKIREFWEEQHRTRDKSGSTDKLMGKEEETDEVDDEVEERKPPPRNERASRTRTRDVADYSQSQRYNPEYLGENVPRYQIQNITKMYPNPTSTANPHTKRLGSGSPPNYDINRKIKEMISAVSPVNTSGFTKYLTFWKQMWNKKQEAKEAQENEAERGRYSSENTEDDQAKQSMKVMENDELFMKKQRKYNQYDSKRSYHETTSTDDTSENENYNKLKNSDRSNQRYYSTLTQPISFNGLILGPYDTLRSKSKATTRPQIKEMRNFSGQYYDYNIENYRPFCHFKCDPKSSNGANAQLPGNRNKNDTSRVEEFVDKFKNALAAENNPEFKKINVVYGSGSDKPHKRHVKVKISKIIEETKSESEFRNKEDELKKISEKLSRKSHSAKKK